MAGCISYIFGPIDFGLGFIISEIVSKLSQLKMEDLLMVKKVFYEVSAYAMLSTNRIIGSWRRHLPSGLSLLKSLRNSSEKVLRFVIVLNGAGTVVAGRQHAVGQRMSMGNDFLGCLAAK